MEFRPTTPAAPRAPPVLSELEESILLRSINRIKEPAVGSTTSANASDPGHHFTLPERLRPTSSLAVPMRRGGIKGSGLRKTLHRGHAAVSQSLDGSTEATTTTEPNKLDESDNRLGPFTDAVTPRTRTNLVNLQLYESSAPAQSQRQVSSSRNMRGWKISSPGLPRTASHTREGFEVGEHSDISKYRVFQRQVSAVDKVLR
jgi:hypothetical protein